MTESKPMMKRVRLHLRSGSVIKIRVRELDIKLTGGKLTSYTWSGMPVKAGPFWRRRLLFVEPQEIVAIEVRGG